MLRARPSTSRAVCVCIRQYARKTPYEDPHYKGPIPTNSVWERSKKAVQRVNKLFTITRREPISFNYPSITGREEEDDDVPMRERLVIAQERLAIEAEKLKNETLDKYWRENYIGDKNRRPQRQYELRIVVDFAKDEDYNQFFTGADSDANIGYSTCELTRTPRQTALFTGNLDKTLIKDGRVKRTGFAAMATKPRRKSFYREHTWGEELDGYTGLAVRLRGDGRTYTMVLRTPQDNWDITWGENYMYPVYTHGGPYWQTTFIPFSKFYKSSGSRIATRQNRIPMHRIRTFGFTLADRNSGPFSLEVAWIGAYLDRTDTEVLAYERYRLKPEAAEHYL